VTSYDSATGATLRQRAGGSTLFLADFLPFFSFLESTANIDSTFDRIGAGSSHIQFTIRGLRADGSTWQLTRKTPWASEYDISFDSMFELADYLNILATNRFEHVKFTSVAVTASVEDAVKTSTIARVLVSRDGHDYFSTTDVVVRPGQRLYLRVYLTQSDSTTQRIVDTSVVIPSTARSGYLQVTGGGQSFVDYYCFFADAECGSLGGVSSFDGLLAALQNQTRNNELGARLYTSTHRLQATRQLWLDRVVYGRKLIYVVVK
jgi:hypothetical protein